MTFFLFLLSVFSITKAETIVMMYESMKIGQRYCKDIKRRGFGVNRNTSRYRKGLGSADQSKKVEKDAIVYLLLIIGQ